MPNYISFPVTVSPTVLVQRAFAFLQNLMPSWRPFEGEMDVWVLEATSTEVSELVDVASHVPDTIYRYFGATLVGITPVDSTVAIGASTWYVNDSSGHTIPAGTQVAIQNSVGDFIPFLTMGDVGIPSGSNVTAPGQVVLIALSPGARSNNIGTTDGEVFLQDILDFVDHITLVAPTSGGGDAETDYDYLNRLTIELRLLTRTPILPKEFSILAKTVPPAYRAYTLDLYNPADDSFGNPRMVTVFAIDSTGSDVDSATKTAIKNLLQSRREVNFIVNMGSPVYTMVDVTAAIAVLPGYDPYATVSAVIDALNYYLNPANWGTDSSSGDIIWNNRNGVYKYEIGQIINSVPGVDRIVGALLIGPHGGTLAEADFTLAGRVSLPRAGTMTVTVA